MVKEINLIFSDKDIELLSKRIPEKPCDTCDADGCFGCPRADRYGELIKPYEDAGIEEYAFAIARIRKINDEIKKLKREMNGLIHALPDDIVKNKSIKFKSWEVK